MILHSCQCKVDLIGGREVIRNKWFVGRRMREGVGWGGGHGKVCQGRRVV